jgi:hypothetical protein
MQRGRKGNKNPIVSLYAIPHERPAPPSDFGLRQSEVWNEVIRGMRAGWYCTAAAPLLRLYCSWVWQSELIEQELTSTPISDLKKYARIAAQYRQASRMIATLATRLRLTQQSNRHFRDAYDDSRGAKQPWED